MSSDKTLGELVETADGSMTIRNPDIDEEYHSTAGAAFESEELYLSRSGIQEQWLEAKDLQVLDVGLGLGYNALTTITKWLGSAGSCSIGMLSLEINESLVKHLAQGDGPWMEGWSDQWLEIAKSLELQPSGLWQAEISHESGVKFQWSVQVGDSSKSPLPQLNLNYIWQDAFSPGKNSELWSPAWFKMLAESSHDNCVLMTYSVSRVVKDGLTEGGWDFERIPASGKKRHWLKATKALSLIHI